MSPDIRGISADIEFFNLQALMLYRANSGNGNTMLRGLRKLLISDKGATAVEYGLILALVVLAAMSAIVRIGGSTISMWNNVAVAVTES